MASTLISKPGKTDLTTVNDRRRKFEAEMRSKGYKRVMRWVPDLSNLHFTAEYRRQLEAIAKHQRKFGASSFLPPEEDIPGWS